VTRSAAERPYLSIGEVLGLLLEEFPDVTISKIRFLESQGLIEPERTASGYRKFYDEDVELLRYILREQKEHFLPLRVIKDRLETPPEGLDRPPPRGIKNVTTSMPRPDPSTAVPRPDSTAAIDRSKTLGHPAAQRVLRPVESRGASNERRPVPPDPSGSFDRTASYSRREIVAMLECDPEMVRELERFGMIEPRLVGEESMFDEQDLVICEIARDFIEAGVDIRHLRAWKTGADREAGLFEQRVLPILRKRTPEARQEVSELLDELSDLGARLRTALLARALATLRDGR
jgi:DNA-binding transcriptional MerR regulator